MAYKLLAWGVLRILDGARIPTDPANRDYQEFLQWLSLGNTPLPADPPPPPVDQAEIDNLEKSLKALGLVTAQWNGKSVAQLKAAFRAAMESL